MFEGVRRIFGAKAEYDKSGQKRYETTVVGKREEVANISAEKYASGTGGETYEQKMSRQRQEMITAAKSSEGQKRYEQAVATARANVETAGTIPSTPAEVNAPGHEQDRNAA